MKHGDLRPGDLLRIESDASLLLIIAVEDVPFHPDLVKVTKWFLGCPGYFSMYTWHRCSHSIGELVARSGDQ